MRCCFQNQTGIGEAVVDRDRTQQLSPSGTTTILRTYQAVSCGSTAAAEVVVMPAFHNIYCSLRGLLTLLYCGTPTHRGNTSTRAVPCLARYSYNRTNLSEKMISGKDTWLVILLNRHKLCRISQKILWSDMKNIDCIICIPNTR